MDQDTRELKPREARSRPDGYGRAGALIVGRRMPRPFHRIGHRQDPNPHKEDYEV